METAFGLWPSDFLRYLDQRSMVMLKRCNRELRRIVTQYFVPSDTKNSFQVVISDDHLDIQHRMKTDDLEWNSLLDAACEKNCQYLIDYAEKNGAIYTLGTIGHAGGSGNLALVKRAVDKTYDERGNTNNIYTYAINNGHLEVFEYLYSCYSSQRLTIFTELIDVELLRKMIEIVDVNGKEKIDISGSFRKAFRMGNLKLIIQLDSLYCELREEGYVFMDVFWERAAYLLMKYNSKEVCIPIIDWLLSRHRNTVENDELLIHAAKSENTEMFNYVFTKVAKESKSEPKNNDDVQLLLETVRDALSQISILSGVIGNDYDITEARLESIYQQVKDKKGIMSACINDACTNSNNKVLDFLARKGIEIDAKYILVKDGESTETTARLAIERYGFVTEHAQTILRNKDLLRLLLKTCNNFKPDKLFLTACKHAIPDAIEILYQKYGAQGSLDLNTGLKALSSCDGYHSTKCTKMLIQYGVNIPTIKNAFRIACMSNNTPVIKCFLDYAGKELDICEGIRLGCAHLAFNTVDFLMPHIENKGESYIYHTIAHISNNISILYGRKFLRIVDRYSSLQVNEIAELLYTGRYYQAYLHSLHQKEVKDTMQIRYNYSDISVSKKKYY